MTKQFFNMIASKDGTACILLYGAIGSWDDADVRSGDIVRELMEIEGSYNKIDVRINNMGGEVYAGIAIFNAIRNTAADITIYVDGIAASMASAIASCGKTCLYEPVCATDDPWRIGWLLRQQRGYPPVHRRNGVAGKNTYSYIAKRTNKTEEEIKQRFFDGHDHWLTADEALAEGLIDGIYDADPIPLDSTPRQVYDILQNRLTPNNMLIDELRKDRRLPQRQTMKRWSPMLTIW